MNNTLTDIIKRIEEKKKVAKMRKDLDEITNPHVKRTKLGHVKRAEADLKDLYVEYRAELQRRATFILVTGSQSEKAAKMCEEDFGCFSIDAENFYKDIIEQIPAKLYTNYTSSPSLFDHVMARFEDRALDIGIVGYNGMYFKGKYKKVLKDKGDTLNLIKTAFNESVGAEVIGLDAVDRVAQKAVKEEFTAKTAPIVLHSKDEELIKALSKDLKRISGNIFIISTGTKVAKELKDNSISCINKLTKENLEKTLLKIKENLN